MKITCTSANYYNNQPTYNNANMEEPIITSFSGSVTFSEENVTSNTFQINFTNLISALPYLPGRTYDLNITEVVPTAE
jgi:hypothetical protein